jgi:ATPase family AAA domain-containing protein 3A/B
MVAERFAEYSGLEYAIMAGGDVAPLEEAGVTELHRLFKWVQTSRHGVLLFIDEADAFLCNRSKGNMSEHLRNALTTMLYHTGTPSKQFMLVLATNRPGDMDAAVIDRIDEAVEFPLPDTNERARLMKQYYLEHLGKVLPVLQSPAAKKQGDTAAGGNGKTENGAPTDEVFLQVAQQIRGFSGREINKLCMALQTHIYAEMGTYKRSSLRQPTSQMIFEVVDKKVREHNRAIDFLQSGYQYQHAQSPQQSPTSKPAYSFRTAV